MIDRWLVIAGTTPDVEHAVGLEAEVKLLDDGLGEQLDQRRRVGEGRHRDAPDEEGGDEAHDGQVVAHEGGDVYALHLHDDLFARLEHRTVHLCDRGRHDGDRIEAGEGVLEGPGELCSIVAFTTLNDSAGTRSRRSLNWDTTSSGKIPSPDERIWPSLMYVGPRCWKLTRRRLDSARRECSVPFRRSRRYQSPNVPPSDAGHAGDPPRGRQPATAHEARQLGSRPCPERGHVPAPGKVLGIDDEGRRLAEGVLPRGQQASPVQPNSVKRATGERQVSR